MGKRKLNWLSYFQYKQGNIPHNKDCKDHDSNFQVDKRPPVERLTCDTFQGMVTTTSMVEQFISMTIKDQAPTWWFWDRGEKVQAVNEYLYVGDGSPESDFYRLLHNKKIGTLLIRIILTKCPPAQIQWTGTMVESRNGDNPGTTSSVAAPVATKVPHTSCTRDLAALDQEGFEGCCDQCGPVCWSHGFKSDNRRNAWYVPDHQHPPHIS